MFAEPRSIKPLYSRQIYQVHDVTFDVTVEDTFDTRDGPVTYRQYYSEKYGQDIHDSQQPLLVHKRRDG
jgi:aubergine-like protein